MSKPYEEVNHPQHYGGAEDPYEAVKVIEAWELTFHTGNVVKYIKRAGKKPGVSYLKDLKKALWYLQRAIEYTEQQGGSSQVKDTHTPRGNDSHASESQ